MNSQDLRENKVCLQTETLRLIAVSIEYSNFVFVTREEKIINA